VSLLYVGCGMQFLKTATLSDAQYRKCHTQLFANTFEALQKFVSVTPAEQADPVSETFGLFDV